MALKWGFAQVDQQLYPPGDVRLRADTQRMFDEAATLRPKYWRLGASWALNAKTKSPGSFVAGTPPTTTGRDWSTLDYSLNEALLLGAEPVLIVGAHRPKWGGWWFGLGATPATAADFGPYCTEVAQRYKPGGVGIRTDGKYAPNAGKGVTIFEIWNEENDQNHWGQQISAKDYTAYLKNGYQAIKAVPGLEGANSTVMFGGTYHVQRVGLNGGYWGYGSASLPEIDFVTQCYKYGAKPYFDSMAVHVYPHLDDFGWNGSTKGPAPSTNSDNWRQMVEIRQLMEVQGDGAKPISITEAGFPNSRVTEAQQDAYWQQMFAMFEALPYVDMVLFYCVRDKGTDPKDTESTWGAMRYDFSKKPVWTWLESLAALDNPVIRPQPAIVQVIGSHPTLALGTTLRPQPAIVTVAGMQPDVRATQNRTVQPAPATPAVVGGVPAIVQTDRKVIQPGPAVVTVIGGAPTLGAVVRLVPEPAALVFTGATPTVRVSDNRLVMPTKASLVFTGGTPTVTATAHKVLAPAPAVVALTGGTPVVTSTDHKVITPEPAVVTVTGGTPAVAVSNNVVPVAFQQAIAPTGTSLGFNPSISRTFNVDPTPAPLLAGLAAFVTYASNSNHGTRYATWGGVAMTALVDFTSGTVNVAIFGLLGIPDTAQAVVMGITGGSNAGREIVGMPLVYENVGSFGLGSGVAGSSLVVPSAVGEIALAALASLNTSMSAFSGTVRGGPTLSGGGATMRGYFGDAAGANPDVTVAATGASRMAAVRLKPAA